jgi:hypothetical protein
MVMVVLPLVVLTQLFVAGEPIVGFAVRSGVMS